MPQSFSCLHAHVIFSTKNRAPWLTPSLTERLYPFVGGLVRNRKCTLLRIGGIADHVHLLVQQARDISVAELVGEVKSISSGWIKDVFPSHSDFAWQQGYAAFSVSLSGLDRLIAYIENQAEHHRRKTYQEEVREFLDKHGIRHDERYMWD
jgi:REP element-mobilizing transposase RayT